MYQTSRTELWMPSVTVIALDLLAFRVTDLCYSYKNTKGEKRKEDHTHTKTKNKKTNKKPTNNPPQKKFFFFLFSFLSFF